MGGLPGWLIIAEEGDIAVVAIDVLVEPAVNNNVRSAFLKRIVPNGRAGREVWTVPVLFVSQSRISPNSAANRLSPRWLKFTTRLPGVESREAHFSSANRVISAAPSVPAR